MLILLNTHYHDYQIFDPETDQELRAILRNNADHIYAALFSSDSGLRSDCYCAVLKDHIVTEFEPFDVDVTMTFVDRHMREAYEIDQTFSVRTLSDFYNFGVLVHMMDSLRYSTINLLHHYDIEIALQRLRLIRHGRFTDWSASKHKGTVVDFIRQELNLWIDTDEMLTMVPNDDDCERGRLIVSGPYGDGTEVLHTGPHHARLMLNLENGVWHIRSRIWDEVQNDAYGFCINDTGLLYLAIHPLAKELLEMSSADVTLRYGRYVDHDGVSVPVVDAEAGMEYVMYDLPDLLYGMVYLPQIVDFDHLIYDPLPVSLRLHIRQRERWSSREYDLPRGDGRIFTDLCYMVADLLLSDDEGVGL